MICSMSEKAKTSSKKKSTVRHTRAVQRDRSMRPMAAPPAEQVSARLQEVILPAAQAKQEKAHHDFGVRARKLTLVVMTAFVISLIVDLTDTVAEALQKPFAAISLEMVYRSLYFFGQAVLRGEATDLIAYLAANAKSLGLLKRKRKHKRLSLALLLDLTNPAKA
jgi:hypothetical protein